MKESPHAITGIGAITALGPGCSRLFSGLIRGQRAFRPVTAFSVDGCRVTIAAEVCEPLSARGSSRTAQLAVAAIDEALASSPAILDKTRVGIVLGSAGAGTTELEDALAAQEVPRELGARYAKKRVIDEVAEAFGFVGGPRTVVNTACSSGAVALAIASDWLRSGDCDVALALGSDELSRFTFSGFHALRAMDPEPCRPFDRSRRGLSMGEGAACLVLERPHDARRRGAIPRAILRGVGLSCDAYHLTAPDPTGQGAARAMHEVLRETGLSAEHIGFINAHGTGTPLNDVAEVCGIESVLGTRAKLCPVHSAKASIGHCMGAAGAIEAVITVMSLEQGVVPHTAGLQDCEFDGRVFCPKDEPISIQASHAMSVSFGFGGNNAAVLLSREDTLEEHAK